MTMGRGERGGYITIRNGVESIYHIIYFVNHNVARAFPFS